MTPRYVPMKIVLIAVLGLGLVGLIAYQWMERGDLRAEIERLKSNEAGSVERNRLQEENTTLTRRVEALTEKVAEMDGQTAEAGQPEATDAPGQQKPSSVKPSRKMMKEWAKMMENEQMREMMVAQQRGAMETQFKDLYESLPKEGTHVTISGTTGTALEPRIDLTVLSSTDLVTPLELWEPIGEGVSDENGDFTIESDVNPVDPRRFFRVGATAVSR